MLKYNEYLKSTNDKVTVNLRVKALKNIKNMRINIMVYFAKYSAYY